MIERRQSARVGTMENEIVLEWQESTGTHCSAGQIVNISEHGALVLSDPQVRCTGRVFIQMKSPVKTDRIAARVVRWGRDHELGMDFPDGCQWDFKLAATMGIDFKGLFGLSDAERFSHCGD